MSGFITCVPGSSLNLSLEASVKRPDHLPLLVKAIERESCERESPHAAPYFPERPHEPGANAAPSPAHRPKPAAHTGLNRMLVTLLPRTGTVLVPCSAAAKTERCPQSLPAQGPAAHLSQVGKRRCQAYRQQWFHAERDVT